jgi:anthraniloyl-CoA monooxygenase
MKIVCKGGGPAGLYFAISAKFREPGHDIVVLERDAVGATYGFGVTVSDNTLDILFNNDVESARQIRAAAQLWQEQEVRLIDQRAYLPGYGYTIGRARLLDVLTDRALALGIDVRHETPIDDAALMAEFADADIVVAADGAGSTLREMHAAEFGTGLVEGTNRYIWLGTTKRFDRFRFSFEHTPGGWVWGYGYPSSASTSTFIVECTANAWVDNGFDSLPPADGVRMLEKFFADHLDGHPLIGESNGKPARWLQFKQVTNQTWHHGKVVLIGDAAHTTHFTMGFGTRLAMTDAVVLAQALLEHADDAPAALAHYDRLRRAEVARIQARARRSMAWFENVEHYLDRNAAEFAYSLSVRGSQNPPWHYQTHLALQKYALARSARRRYEGARRWLIAARRGEYALVEQTAQPPA